MNKKNSTTKNKVKKMTKKGKKKSNPSPFELACKI
jgi:hypothetical protein